MSITRHNERVHRDIRRPVRLTDALEDTNCLLLPFDTPATCRRALADVLRSRALLRVACASTFARQERDLDPARSCSLVVQLVPVLTKILPAALLLSRTIFSPNLSVGPQHKSRYAVYPSKRRLHINFTTITFFSAIHSHPYSACFPKQDACQWLYRRSIANETSFVVVVVDRD